MSPSNPTPSSASSSAPSSGSSRPKWVKWVVIGAVVLIVLVVGIPFAYIHFGSSDAPAPLALTAGSAVTTTAGAGSGASGSSGVDGTYKVASGSTAGYRIQETLAGQSTEAVGRTTAVTGSATIASKSLTNGTFTVDLTKVSSDKSQRDGQFQTRIMETSKYPSATFKLTQPVDLSSAPTDGSNFTVKATGELTIHGVTKPVTLDLTAQKSGSTIKVSGNTLVTFSDYDIDNPSSPVATVGDSGQLEFLLTLAA
jgi:polyisoprenoid-binding protein YceI